MGPKYEFTDDTMNHDGHLLHRIKRLSDGKLGGWIETEENLSQDGNCWVGDEAKVYDGARVFDNAEVYGDADICYRARVFNDAKVWDCNTICDAQVYGNAQIYDNATVRNSAEVYGDAEVSDNAWISDEVCISGNAKVYDHAIISDYAQVYGHARVYGYAMVKGNAQVYDSARVYGYADVYDYAKICGSMEVDYTTRSDYSDKFGNKVNNEIDEQLKDFIYKIDDSQTLKVESNYSSIDEFFDSDFESGDNLTIKAVNADITLITIEKVLLNSDTEAFKFIVDISNENDDEFTVKTTFDSQEKFKSLLEATINALKEYKEFYKYAEDLENCL